MTNDIRLHSLRHHTHNIDGPATVARNYNWASHNSPEGVRKSTSEVWLCNFLLSCRTNLTGRTATEFVGSSAKKIKNGPMFKNLRLSRGQ